LKIAAQKKMEEGGKHEDFTYTNIICKMIFDPTFYGGAILGIIALGFAAAPMMVNDTVLLRVSSVMVLTTVELCEQLAFNKMGNKFKPWAVFIHVVSLGFVMPM
jgi:hypothetical protein